MFTEIFHINENLVLFYFLSNEYAGFVLTFQWARCIFIYLFAREGACRAFISVSFNYFATYARYHLIVIKRQVKKVIIHVSRVNKILIIHTTRKYVSRNIDL